MYLQIISIFSWWYYHNEKYGDNNNQHYQQTSAFLYAYYPHVL